MKTTPTELKDVLIIEPDFFGDHRGYFMETFQRKRYRQAGIDIEFVQDNISFSVQNTLRGLHYQYPYQQAKLVQVLQGEIFDVAVDIRRQSPTFGHWTGATLSETNKRQFFIPEGFAHGFCVMSKTALFLYKCSYNYTPEDEYGICWDDSDLKIVWPVPQPILSERDRQLPKLVDVSPDRLPCVEKK
ncbi:MAG: dTDP-4-dehydrorhamnose 3,5-epimerase [Desulfobacteraceae bacterium]|nr:dTDP-4-dehydrorhamnose 3,5-epimerase [Desulfobacteraceae bacterium]